MLNRLQCANFEVTVGNDFKFSWSKYDILQAPRLVDVVLEVKPKQILANQEHIETIDARVIEKALGNSLHDHIVTRHERIWLTCNEKEYLLRVLDVTAERAEDEEDEGVVDEDDFRGRIVPGMFTSNMKSSNRLILGGTQGQSCIFKKIWVSTKSFSVLKMLLLEPRRDDQTTRWIYFAMMENIFQSRKDCCNRVLL